MGTIERKLEQMGVKLLVAAAGANYVLAKRVGNLVYSAGQGPVEEWVAGEGPFPIPKLGYVGKVGADLSEEEGYQAARLCAINCLAALKTVITSLDEVEEIVNVRGYVNCTQDFIRQPAVMNGASDFLIEVFGEKGKHSRTAIGTWSMPFNIPVEVELVARVKD